MTSERWFSNDEDAASVLAAALALIDEAYPTPTSPPQASSLSSSSSPRCRCAPTARRQELSERRAQVVELQKTLEEVRAYRDSDPPDGSNRTDLWAQVARNQLHQRSETVRENALLKEYVRTHKALAQELRRASASLVSTTTHATLATPLPRQISTCIVSVSLASRLDAIAARASPNWIGLSPAIDGIFSDRRAELKKAGDALSIQFRYASYMPFKLSLIASELWDLMLNDSYGIDPGFQVSDQSPDDAFGQPVLRLSASRSSRLEVKGPTALRRIFTADGSIVFAAASIGVGSTCSSATAVDGLEFHEMSWIRVGRVPTAPSLVYLESFCYLDIQPASDVHGYESKFRRVRDLCCSRDVQGPTNLQKLENRLLDLTHHQRGFETSASLRVH